MMNLSTAAARILAFGLLIAVAGPTAAQPAYPNKPIRVIVPNPPGGGTTIMGRLIGQKLTESWGQPVVVDNRPGGNGFIGGEALTRSLPDGHTIIVISSTHVITPLLIPASYDAVEDFAAVATLAKGERILVVHPSVPANNLRELIALAKSKPGQFNYGSAGEGSMARLAGAFFDIMTGTRMQNISYKGTGQMMTDLLGGRVQLTFTTPPPAIPQIKNGKLKAIAMSGQARLSALPQVPTFDEAGLPGFDVSIWYGIAAPRTTQRGIVDKLSTEIGKMLAMPDIREKLISQGVDPFVSSPAQFSALMKADAVKYAKIIKTANIKPGE